MSSLRSQLILSHLLLVLLMGFVMSGASVTFFSITQSIDHVLQGNFRTVLAAQEMNASLQEQETAFALLSNGDIVEARITYGRASSGFEKALSVAMQTASTQAQKSYVTQLSMDYDHTKRQA